MYVFKLWEVLYLSYIIFKRILKFWRIGVGGGQIIFKNLAIFTACGVLGAK